MNILVVDDDIAIRNFLSRRLSKEGWKVATVVNSDECLNKIQTDGFDWAIIDVNLGSENGIDLAKQVRVSKPNLKLILMSGQLDNMDKVREAGFGEMLLKPFEFSQLRTLMGDS